MNMELFKAGLIYEISKQLDSMEIDEEKIISAETDYLLSEIHFVIKNENLSDSEKISRIKELFESRDIDAGSNQKLKVIKK